MTLPNGLSLLLGRVSKGKIEMAEKIYLRYWTAGSFRFVSDALSWMNQFETSTSTIEVMQIYQSGAWMWVFIKVMEEA